MVKTAICYYSMTGNGFHIAKEMQKQLGSDLLYIPNSFERDLSEYDTIIIVSPVYMFALPNIIKAYIKTLKYRENQDYYLVLNFGGFSANAPFYAQRLFAEQNIKIKNVFRVTMPVTYTIFMREPDIFINHVLKKSKKKIDRAVKKIKSKEIKKIRKNIFFFLDIIHDNIEKNWINMPKTFVVLDTCDKCGYCVEKCPVDNIRMTEHGIEFLDKCISCLGCYHRCPKQAINYGDKTKGKARYQNPYVNLNEMK